MNIHRKSKKINAASDVEYAYNPGQPQITFNSSKEIHEALLTKDLYCVNTEDYLFMYNTEEVGSIGVYPNISIEELYDLAEDADIANVEYISAILGPGGYIVDPDDYDGEFPNHDGDYDMTPIYEFLDQFVGCGFIYADVKDLVKE